MSEERLENLRVLYRINKPDVTPNAIIVTDPGKDLDDENALILAAGLHRINMINLVGVIANLEPSLERACLAKGTLKMLGLPNIPVGQGAACFTGGINLKHETEAEYSASPKEIVEGATLYQNLLKNAEDKSVILILNSGLTDTAQVFEKDPDTFIKKVFSVSIMGGVVSDKGDVLRDERGFMQAQVGKGGASNNCFDESAAEYVHKVCQENRIQLTILMREAAYACQIPVSFYDKLAETGNPIGINLRNRQMTSINILWQAANANEGSPVRGSLPMSRDRAWFLKTFCAGINPDASYQGDIWPYVGKFQLYDPMNVIAAVPALCYRFFNPTEVPVRGEVHNVIGLNKENHGIDNEKALRSFMMNAEIATLEMAQKEMQK